MVSNRVLPWLENFGNDYKLRWIVNQVESCCCSVLAAQQFGCCYRSVGVLWLVSWIPRSKEGSSSTAQVGCIVGLSLSVRFRFLNSRI